MLPSGESRRVCRRDRQMDGRQTVIYFPLDAASVTAISGKLQFRYSNCYEQVQISKLIRQAMSEQVRSSVNEECRVPIRGQRVNRIGDWRRIEMSRCSRTPVAAVQSRPAVDASERLIRASSQSSVSNASRVLVTSLMTWVKDAAVRSSHLYSLSTGCGRRFSLPPGTIPKVAYKYGIRSPRKWHTLLQGLRQNSR